MPDAPTPEQVASFRSWASGIPAADSTTSAVVALLDELDPVERQSAEVLALARYDAAWRSGGHRHWRDLSATERAAVTVEAAHWLRAARAIGLAP